MGKRRAAPHGRGRRLGGAAPGGAAPSRSRAPPSTSSDESGGVDQEDELCSPTATGAALPALGEKDLPRLVERYAAMGFHLPKKAANFKPEDARLKFSRHLSRWGFDKLEAAAANPRGQQGAAAPAITSPLAGCALHADMTDAKLHELLALPLEKRKLTIFASGVGVVNEQLGTRGYCEQPLIYMSDDVHMPEEVDSTPRPSPAAPDAGQGTAQPALVLPPEMPGLPKGRPAAATIVKQMEDGVHVDGMDYAAMRLWTVQARGRHEKLRAQTTLFGRRCRLYLYVVSLGVDPEAVTEAESVLRGRMEQWKGALPEDEQKALGWEQAARVAGERRAAAGLSGLAGGL